MTFNPTEYLQGLHTRELLKLLKTSRKFNGYVDITFNHGNCIVYVEQIKAELATREHIPNKQEAKAKRQRIAKEKKSR